MINWKTIAAGVFCATAFANAHLKSGSLLPAGGEVVKVGDVFTIKWTDAQVHNDRIDIALSKDNGVTWADLKTNSPDENVDGVFKWTVPSTAVSAQAKIRVCQSGPCTQAQNTNNFSGDAPWRLVSSTFTIQASTALAAPAGSSEGLTVDYHPDSRNVEVSFSLAQAGEVALQAFDMQGRLVAGLVQARFAAGEHRFSVFSNRLDGAQGLVFKLNAGGQTRSNTWITLR